MAPILVKSLSRLSRASLIDLAVQWTHSQYCPPYLSSNRNITESDEEDYLYTPAPDVDALREVYRLLRQEGKSAPTKRDIVDRIVDGDWRRGLSLDQLAMVDFAYLEQNDRALRWSALKLVPRMHSCDDIDDRPVKKRKVSHSSTMPQYPRVSPSSFVAALQSETSALVKAHYYLHRLPPPYNLSILRLYIVPNLPFAPPKSSILRNSKHATDAGRVMYIALPDSCPYVYISLSGSTSRRTPGEKASGNGPVPAKVDMATMKRIILEAIPRALSRPQERWALESTKLTTKSLKSVCGLRGNGTPASSGGVYAALVDESSKETMASPLDVQIPNTIPDTKNEGTGSEEVEVRFGTMHGSHHAALDRVHVKIEDVVVDRPPGERTKKMEDCMPISITFSGSDIFLGLKKLAELGLEYVDLDRMPAWMTGDMGMTTLTV